ncbi:MAG: DUF190 domain-containing protein [Nitrososphaeraceae archaeon]
MGAKISGATVWTGVDGFGKRSRPSAHLEGITINMPMVIEVVDEKSKLEPLLLQIRRMVGDNELVTLHEVKLTDNTSELCCSIASSTDRMLFLTHLKS